MIRLMQSMAGARHGGAEAFFVRLAKAFQEAASAGADIEQRVVIRRDPARAQELRAGGVEPVELPFGGLLDWSTRPALARLMRDFRPTVLLTWMNRATKMVPKLKGSGVVHAARLGGYYDRKYYLQCDHLIANTHDIARYLCDQGFAADRVHMVPNFVDEGHLPPVSRAAFDTPADVPLLLCLGRLHTNKAFDVAIRSLARLPDAVLWIAGEGPERQALIDLAAREGVAGRVRFLGWRSDAPALIAACDLLLCPSRHEPLGNVVLEGWAQGRPVVAADSAGPRELIRDHQDGRLVPMEDAAALADAIAALLADPAARDAMVAAGHARIAEEFSRQAVVARYLDLFRRITA